MKQDTIWITGAAGGIGSALLRDLSRNTDYKILATDKEDVDVSDLQAVKQAVDIYKPTVIINCAAITDKDYCEDNMVEAFKVNALGARNLAAESRRVNAKIIQLSSDDVFDNKTSGRMTEYDNPDAKSVYGKSKIAAEMYVRELNTKHIIVRSSWVYGMSDHDFFSKIVDCGEKGLSINVPADKISTPTSVTELAKIIEMLIDTPQYGVYHASCEGICSRKEFARGIMTLMGYDPDLVKGTFSDHKGGQTSTLLENLMLKMTELYEMPDWRTALKAYVDSIK